jgi:hypothetical protein
MIEELIGQTLTSVIINEENDVAFFVTTEGATYEMEHRQDCCETVYIQDVCGDIEDLLYTPIVMAEGVSSYTGSEAKLVAEASARAMLTNKPTLTELEEHLDSFTWTFYKIGTNKGSVTIRWLGESNGYYSESVSFNKVGNPI